METQLLINFDPNVQIIVSAAHSSQCRHNLTRFRYFQQYSVRCTACAKYLMYMSASFGCRLRLTRIMNMITSLRETSSQLMIIFLRDDVGCNSGFFFLIFVGYPQCSKRSEWWSYLHPQIWMKLDKCGWIYLFIQISNLSSQGLVAVSSTPKQGLCCQIFSSKKLYCKFLSKLLPKEPWCNFVWVLS